MMPVSEWTHVRQHEVPDLVREGSAKGNLERIHPADLREPRDPPAEHVGAPRLD